MLSLKLITLLCVIFYYRVSKEQNGNFDKKNDINVKKNDLGPWNREDICTSEICKACNNSILPKSNCLESDYVIFDCRDKTY